MKKSDYLIIFVNFLVPGSESAFPIRIRIQDSQINAVDGFGSGLLIINAKQVVYKETVPVRIKYAATIISISGDYRTGGGGQGTGFSVIFLHYSTANNKQNHLSANLPNKRPWQ